MSERVLFYLLFLVVGFVASIVLAGTRLRVYALILYVGVLMVFENQNGWGMVISDLSEVDNIYNKGVGVLGLSLVNIYLFFLAGALPIISSDRREIKPHNLSQVGWVFILVFVLNVIYGLATDVELERIFDYKGVMNIINLCMLFSVLVYYINEQSDYNLLVNSIVILAVLRGVWGLFRFVFLGGDPSNFYANNQGLDVKLTFFDINDSLVATMVAFIAAWRYLSTEPTLLGRRLMYLSIVILEVLIVVLSYRRTAWGGLLMAYILFMLCQRPEVRRNLIFVGVIFVVPAIFFALLKRTDGATGEISLAALFPDIYQDGEISFNTGRFAELYAVWITLENSLLFGAGVWGVYDGSSFIELDFHEGDFSWMHSGLFHIALKMGLIGISIVVVVMVLFFKFIRRSYRLGDTKNWDVFMAGAAGLLFSLPNWFFGTPIIEFRTMQLMALAMALPYIAQKISAKGRSEI